MLSEVGELTLSKMIRLMIERQPKLLERFHELDPEGTTKVPRKKFVQVRAERGLVSSEGQTAHAGAHAEA